MGVAVLMMMLGGCGDGGSQTSEVATAAHPGEQTYNRFCFSCHAGGIAGAPRTGSIEQWAPRIAKGQAVLLRTTIDGITPGMPARGLCTQCTDEQLVDAIDFMISKSQ
jgi:cytochrome c5